MNPNTGQSDYQILSSMSIDELNQYSAFVYPQINSLGVIEDVDLITNFCQDNRIRSIACIDPFLLGEGGLKPPVEFGKSGADFIAGDASIWQYHQILVVLVLGFLVAAITIKRKPI